MDAHNYEPEAAIARLDGNEELYRHLLTTFFSDSSGTRGRLDQAVQQSDASAIHRAAHGLKGVAATCGLTGVARLAGQLESMGRQGQLDHVASLHAQIEEAVAAARQHLAGHLA